MNRNSCLSEGSELSIQYKYSIIQYIMSNNNTVKHSTMKYKVDHLCILATICLCIPILNVERHKVICVLFGPNTVKILAQCPQNNNSAPVSLSLNGRKETANSKTSQFDHLHIINNHLAIFPSVQILNNKCHKVLNTFFRLDVVMPFEYNKVHLCPYVSACLGLNSVYNKTSHFIVSYRLTLKVLNFWKFTSYCSLKPLWSGMGEVVPVRTSPTLHPSSPPTVHQLSYK